MSDNKTISVAFLFFSDGKEWQGGKNYFRALFSALDADPECRLRLVALVGQHTDCNDFNFPPSVTFVKTSALDRLSLSWFFDRTCKWLFGRTPLLRRTLIHAGVQVVSHCDPRESNPLPNIAWIPDFQHVHLPRFFKLAQILMRNQQFKIMLERSDLVVVSSRAAREDLESFSKEHAHKARVLQFCAVRPELANDDGEDLVKLYGLADRYFYIPNQVWAHKNHRLADEALAKVCERWTRAQIVCSGALSDYRNSAYIEALRDQISELGLRDSFKLLGLIPYKHVARLIVRSAAVINPSLFEGWSTTVEESKALGAPLLLSDLPVHREQCPAGEALFFAPDDSSELATCMERVLVGDWPKAVGDKVASALEKHKALTLEFSRRYQAIVAEVAHRAPSKTGSSDNSVGR